MDSGGLKAGREEVRDCRTDILHSHYFNPLSHAPCSIYLGRFLEDDKDKLSAAMFTEVLTSAGFDAEEVTGTSKSPMHLGALLGWVAKALKMSHSLFFPCSISGRIHLPRCQRWGGRDKPQAGRGLVAHAQPGMTPEWC